jgi:DNA adenine methylase
MSNNKRRVDLPKPFVKWAGGKGQLLPQIVTYLPGKFDEIEDITYIEPFVGGGAMLFYLLSTYSNITRAIINDISPNLITVYRTVKAQPEKLIAKLKVMEREYLRQDEVGRKAYFYAMRERFNGSLKDDVEKSAMFICLNHTCFNGLYRENSKGEFNVPHGRYVKPTICDSETIRFDSKLLQRVEILQGDFTIIDNYIKGKNTFIYFDPPYRPINATSNFNSYVKEPFDDDEQRRLKVFFADMAKRGCMVMLSNSDCSANNQKDTFFDDLYADFIIERVRASRMVNVIASKRGKLTELLIHNYNILARNSYNINKDAQMVAEPNTISY